MFPQVNHINEHDLKCQAVYFERLQDDNSPNVMIFLALNVQQLCHPDSSVPENSAHSEPNKRSRGHCQGKQVHPYKKQVGEHQFVDSKDDWKEQSFGAVNIEHLNEGGQSPECQRGKNNQSEQSHNYLNHKCSKYLEHLVCATESVPVLVGNGGHVVWLLDQGNFLFVFSFRDEELQALGQHDMAFALVSKLPEPHLVSLVLNDAAGEVLVEHVNVGLGSMGGLDSIQVEHFDILLVRVVHFARAGFTVKKCKE